MRHSYSSRQYALSAYDDYMCLKPPVLLWVAVLYLSKAITLPLAVGIGHVCRRERRCAVGHEGTVSAGALVPSFIAAVILYAFFRVCRVHPGRCAGSGRTAWFSSRCPRAWTSCCR